VENIEWETLIRKNQLTPQEGRTGMQWLHLIVLVILHMFQPGKPCSCQIFLGQGLSSKFPSYIRRIEWRPGR
jgi:hypothetical protein